MYIPVVPKQYSIASARAHLSQIVDEAQSGRQIELTRRGKPVAVVVSRDELVRLSGRATQFRSAYETFLTKHSRRDVGISRGFVKSLRARGQGRKVSV